MASASLNTIQAKVRKAEVLHAYLGRHAVYPPLVPEPPSPGLGLAVVIPSHDEPRLTATLDALWACIRPVCATEVIVALNRAADAPAELADRHAAQVAEALNWAAAHRDQRLRFHMLDFPGLPPRHAGVGLARKLGMDEAVARLAAAHAPTAPIACLDADCRVEPGYLEALERHFREHPDSPACALPFAHDWAAAPDPRLREGIVRYELHLRCVVAGLRLAGHPHAFHTIGSAMAVRADAYARSGGMNRRKGAEDFHFLAKLMPLGGFTGLRGATVAPSGRVSHRVPFGTGRALADWMAGQSGGILSYHPVAYRELGNLLAALPALWGADGGQVQSLVAGLPPTLAGFLRQAGFPARVAEIRGNTASAHTFHQRLLRWLDRFRVLKWLHYSREYGQPDIPVEQAAVLLLEWAGRPVPGGRDWKRRVALLECFRAWEQEATGQGAGSQAAH